MVSKPLPSPPAHLPKPAEHCLSAATDTRSPDPPIFFERAFDFLILQSDGGGTLGGQLLSFAHCTFPYKSKKPTKMAGIDPNSSLKNWVDEI
jgi:hypothetical protein